MFIRVLFNYQGERTLYRLPYIGLSRINEYWKEWPIDK